MRRPTAERTGDRHRGARRLPGWSTLPGRAARRGGGDVPTPPVSLCLSYQRVYGTVARADIIFLRASKRPFCGHSNRPRADFQPQCPTCCHSLADDGERPNGVEQSMLILVWVYCSRLYLCDARSLPVSEEMT